jgi:dienelactone hydrolase
MMPATKESWSDFAQKLTDAGFTVLAIDLRGHGESVPQAIPSETRILNYKNFSDADHQRSIIDVEAAVAFLKSEGASAIHLGGASIGANLALQYLAEHSDAKSAFLLSPGLDYRGIKTEQFAAEIHTGQVVYYVAAGDDPYSARTVDVLYQKTADGIKKEVKVFKRAGHGTDMLLAHSEFMDEIILWLKTL